MTVALSLGSYLEFLSKEYLGDFIRDGGASVKFLVSPDPTAIERAHAGLAEAAAPPATRVGCFCSTRSN